MRTGLLTAALGGSLLSVAFGLTACSSNRGSPAPANDAGGGGGGVAPQPDAGAPGDSGPADDAGGSSDGSSDGSSSTTAPPAVYTLSNDATANAVVAFSRAADGSLTMLGSTPTGGKGTGAGLGDQGALAFDPASGAFYAVNAGDDSISMLALHADGSLALLSNVPSGGKMPISITAHGDLVYVVNAGVSGDAGSEPAAIAGFRVANGALTPIAGSTRPLSAANPGPAQIEFSPDGKVLVVTEKGTNEIDTFVVDASGAAGAVDAQASSGQTPFGFAFGSGGQLVVSEAFGGNANASATSSYTLADTGTLTPVSASVTSGQSAACWVAVAGDYAYVSNAHSANVTGYRIGANGALTMIGTGGVSGMTGAGPIDEAATPDGAFLYVLDSGAHAISVFGVAGDGSLTKQPDVSSGVPTTAAGLIAR